MAGRGWGREKEDVEAACNERAGHWALPAQECKAECDGWPVCNEDSALRGKKRSAEASSVRPHPVPGRRSVHPRKGSYCSVCPTNLPFLGPEIREQRGPRTSNEPGTPALPQPSESFPHGNFYVSFFLSLNINKPLHTSKVKTIQ